MTSNSYRIKTIFHTNLIWATTAHRPAVAKETYSLRWSDFFFYFNLIKPITSFSTKTQFVHKVKNMGSDVHYASIQPSIQQRPASNLDHLWSLYTLKMRKLGLVSAVVSHWVVQHDVLFGQLQQHRIVEELADTDVLAQTLRSKEGSRHTCSNTRARDAAEREEADLAPSSLDHELPGQVGGRLGLQRSDHDAFIQRVTGNDLKGENRGMFRCSGPSGSC